MILTLDVSSTAIGYAVFDGRRRHDAGVITPDTTKERDPCRRAHQMGISVQAVIDEHAGRLDLILVEEPPPTQGKRRSNPAAQHQAYGLIMGIVLGAKVPARSINPATWTGNSKKEARAALIRERHKIPPHVDKGNDGCDAIGMAEWWLEIGQHRKDDMPIPRRD